MDIQLTGVKSAAFASHETDCFEASIVIDGKKAGTVSNDGQGGSNLYWFADRELEKSFYAFCRARPPDVLGGYTLPADEDSYIAELMDKLELEKKLRRWCKTSTVFKLPGDSEESYHTIKTVWGPAVKAYMAKKYPTATIINKQFEAPAQVLSRKKRLTSAM